MLWTDEQVDELRRRWTAGESASQIARAMGLESRNQVIGKIHRLPDIPKRQTKRPVNHNKAKRPRRRDQPNLIFAKRRRDRSAAVHRPEIRPQDVPVPESLGLPLLDLKAGQCRYPYGEGPYLFCGHPTRSESSFCMAHHFICHQPKRERLR